MPIFCCKGLPTSINQPNANNNKMRTAVLLILLVAVLSTQALDMRASSVGKKRLTKVELPPMTYQKAVRVLREMIAERELSKKTGGVKGYPMSKLGEHFGCSLCEEAVDYLVDKGSDWSCDFAFDALAAAACEAAGLGPEDPLADICAAALIEGCSKILGMIVEHIRNPQQICSAIDLC
jgi:hypothetical protein